MSKWKNAPSLVDIFKKPSEFEKTPRPSTEEDEMWDARFNTEKNHKAAAKKALSSPDLMSSLQETERGIAEEEAEPVIKMDPVLSEDILEDEKQETKEPKTTEAPKEDKKDKAPTFNIPKGEQEDLAEQRLNRTFDAYSQLKDPPMTSADLRKQMVEDLKQVRADKEKTLQWANIAERFLAAATKYGAAREGLTRGLDMSQVEIERTDWDSMIDRAYEQYKSDYTDLITKFGEEDKAKESVDAKRLKLKEEELNLREKIAKLRDARDREQRRIEEARLARREKLKTGKLSKTKEAWETTGRPAYLADRRRLEEARELIESGKALTGGLVGIVPRDARTVGAAIVQSFNPELAQEIRAGISVENDVFAVTAKSMREVLGGQFAQREGENIQRNMFYPGMSKEQLLRNLDIIQERLDRAAAARDAGLGQDQINAAYGADMSAEEFAEFRARHKKDASVSRREDKPKVNEVRRRDPKSGKIAIFNADTKEFLRYE